MNPAVPDDGPQRPAGLGPDDRSVPPDRDPAGELGRALARLTRAVSRAKAMLQAESGRTDYAAFSLLVALAEAGPMRASALADAVLSDPSTVSRQVAHLVDLGYVERQPDPEDGRACHLAVTAEGTAALGDHRRARDDYLAELTADWTEHDRRTLAELLDRLAGEFTTDLQERGPFHVRVAPRRQTRHRQEAAS